MYLTCRITSACRETSSLLSNSIGFIAPASHMSAIGENTPSWQTFVLREKLIARNCLTLEHLVGGFVFATSLETLFTPFIWSIDYDQKHKFEV